MPHINRPNTHPIFPGKDGLTTLPTTFSRTPFLNGQHWSLFMPGQSVGRPASELPHEVPTVWPSAGAPLRVPKCVFLNSCPPAHLWGRNFTLVTAWDHFGYFGHWDDPVARDTDVTPPSPPVPEGSLVFDGFSGGYSYIGWVIDPQYNQAARDGRRKWRRYNVVRNSIYDEHNRLIAEFGAAKATLESRYPDQVFVQICEFFPASPQLGVAPNDKFRPNVIDVYSPDGQAANLPKHLSDGPTWMLGPERSTFNPATRADETNFFGTDFLHMYFGYQSLDGILGRDGYFPRNRPDVSDLISRINFPRSSFGYALDPSFFVGYDQFVVSVDPTGRGINDGYENQAYDEMLTAVGRRMSQTGRDGDRVIPQGKLDFLRLGSPKFAGYSAALFNYDLGFDFGSQPNFKTGGGVSTRFPRGDLNYEDQDWVEQSIVLGYDTRRDGDPNTYNDNYYPGEDFDGGRYNFYQRYPDTPTYLNDFIPRLHNQWKWLKQVLENLGPKTSTMWDQLIDDNGLAALGFSNQGGSSRVDADYIVAYVEAHYGLAR